MTRSAKGGFTLIEILVVAVLGSLLILSAYQVLQVTQQSYTTIHNKVTDQNSLRAGADVLFSELREISPSGGDLLAIDSDDATAEAYMRAAGQSGIPTAFIVGRDAAVEWIGHPARIDEPLSQIVDGSWDREAS